MRTLRDDQADTLARLRADAEKLERRRRQKREYNHRRAGVKVYPELTPDRLKAFLRYDAFTGNWTWLVQPRKGINIGDVAGRLNATHGRWEVGIDGRRYSASRLAWFYMTGAWPEREVDHKDANSLNNKWKNLRIATRGQNEANKGLTRRNTSGFKGVSWDRSRQLWKAQIGCGGRPRLIGRFKSPEEAHAAYAVELQRFYGQFARLA